MNQQDPEERDIQQQFLRQKALMEQQMQHQQDILPGYYWNLYQRYKEQGFDVHQALSLVCSQVAGCVKL
jgi:hypothetical protein